MPKIVCVSSPIQCLPIRSLLTQLGFRPQNSRQMAAFSFLYPLNTRYRRSLQKLGSMESAPDAQFLGFATQWRTKRRLTCLALAIAPLVNERGITVYEAQNMNGPTRLFFSLLRHYVRAGALTMVNGQPPAAEVMPRAANYLEPEENRLIDLLHTESLSDVEREELVRYGTACALTANYWQGRAIYETLIASDDLPFAYHCLGMTHSFLGDTKVAEQCYQESVAKQTDPVLKMRGLYSLALLHLRHHPEGTQDKARVRFYLERGDKVLAASANVLSREEYMYAHLFFEAAQALLFFKEGKYEQSMVIMRRGVAMLHTLPPSQMRDFCQAHGLSNVAQLYRVSGDLKKVAQINKQIVAVDSCLPIWWAEYGKVLIELGRYHEAYRTIQRGIELHVDYPDLYALLGLWCHKMGQFPQSIEAYEKACRYDPENITYHDALHAAQARASVYTKKAAFLS